MSVKKLPDVKLRAEWMWVDRWMGSSAFLLPMGPRGLYREMLSQAWLRGARLPNDHEQIRRAVACTLAEWKRYWPEIQQYWRVVGGHLVNDTQIEVYTEALAAQRRASAHGRAGAEARWGRKDRDAGAMPEHMPEDMPGEWPPSPDQDQGTEKSTGAPRRTSPRPVEISTGTHALYCVIAKEALTKSIEEDGTDSLGNVAEIFKTLCGQRRLNYDGDIQTNAINAVLAAHERKAMAS